MIALKNDPIWDRLGSRELFDAGLGNPWPPFAFNSGMNVRDVSRARAVEIGLLGANDPAPQPEHRGLNDSLEAKVTHLNSALQQVLADDPDFALTDGVLTLAK